MRRIFWVSEFLLPTLMGIFIWIMSRSSFYVITSTLLTVIIVGIADLQYDFQILDKDKPSERLMNILEKLQALINTTSDSQLFSQAFQEKLDHTVQQFGDHKFTSENINEIERIDEKLLNGLQSKAFLTFLPSIQMDWDPNEYYYRRIRDLAKFKTGGINNIEIIRVFYIDESLKENLDSFLKLYQHMASDELSGIKVYVIEVSSERDDFNFTTSFSDFAIYDDNILAKQEYGIRGFLLHNTYSISKDELAEARNNRATYLKFATPIEQYRVNLFKPDIPEKYYKELAKTAPIIEETAKSCCKPNTYGTQSCKWYHGSWQYLRLIDMVSSPDWHNSFYIPKIREALADPTHRKILVYGTADYGILEIIYSSMSKDSKSLDITVVDKCETPLIACKSYAESHGYEITTVKGEDQVLKLKRDYYDLIITDHLLTVLPKDQVKVIIDNWFNLLAPGGVLLTTVFAGTEESDPDEKDGMKFIEDGKKSALKNADLIWDKLQNLEIVQMINEYVENIKNRHVGDLNSLTAVFKNFVDVDIKESKTNGEFKHPEIDYEIFAKKPLNNKM
ncbi:MAG: class I SAM-dependent methyltransferase [Candidatus Thermoplasmatota archaeon]|nr:class I SAM-dependent methyltransferase [Candidatus Thermoplasmatota archaeon]